MRRLGMLFSLAALAVLLPACSKQETPGENKGHVVRGKVTYKGEPVVYGHVLFVNLEKPIDPKSRTVSPASSAVIKDGTYEAVNVPIGPMLLFIVSDPDEDLHSLMRTMPGEPKGLPDGAKKDMPKKGQPIGPAAPPNPLTVGLNAGQKSVLREIHAKYGDFQKPGLTYIVHEGEQSFDLVLK